VLQSRSPLRVRKRCKLSVSLLLRPGPFVKVDCITRSNIFIIIYCEIYLDSPVAHSLTQIIHANHVYNHSRHEPRIPIPSHSNHFKAHRGRYELVIAMYLSQYCPCDGKSCSYVLCLQCPRRHGAANASINNIICAQHLMAILLSQPQHYLLQLKQPSSVLPQPCCLSTIGTAILTTCSNSDS
jgi:hypothetical protein